MSTRANIFITNPDTKQSLTLYRHSDGYPEVTGYELKHFCEKAFNPKEHSGLPYDWCMDVFELATKIVKRPEYVLQGYGIDDLDNGADDIEWIYDIELHECKAPVLRVFQNIEHLHGFKRSVEVPLSGFVEYKGEDEPKPTADDAGNTTGAGA